MQRCPNPLRLPALWWGCALLLAGAAVQAHAAGAPVAAAAGQRTFPAAAQHGRLKILDRMQAELNGKPIQVAPGLRIFNPNNALVFAHSLIGQTLQVNYVIEPGTGWLHTVWLLTADEAAQQRKAGAGTPQTALPR